MSDTIRDCIALWSLCFGDGEEIPSSFFERTEAEPVLLRREGTPIAMACLVPVTLDKLRGGYLYAVCVHPEHRGRGYFRWLMALCEEKARKAKLDFVCLVPATPSLSELYERMGYETRVTLSAYATGEEKRIVPEGGFAALAKEWSEDFPTMPQGLAKSLAEDVLLPSPLAFSSPMGES